MYTRNKKKKSAGPTKNKKQSTHERERDNKHIMRSGDGARVGKR